jgi:dATP/dGTP diphosphohydrolase
MTPEERKQRPVFSGVIKYFPDAILEVAHCSYTGNEQHNPGSKLHWDRSKSGDEGDALLRHQIDAGKFDSDGVRHSAKVAWRALAQLQKEIEEANPQSPPEDEIKKAVVGQFVSGIPAK